MGEDVEELRRKARPDDIASLRRLDQALQRTRWRVEGKTIREWISEFALHSPGVYGPQDPVQLVWGAGLAAVPALVETLKTKQLSPRREIDKRIRINCIEALAHMDPVPDCAIPALLETLHVPSLQVRRLALRVLARFRPRPSGLAVRELLACLRSKHEPEIRAQAAHALSQLNGAIPPEVRRAALERLTDPDKRVRRYVLRLLARLPAPDPEARTALEEQVILDDANRLEAIVALLEFDAPRALEFLQEEVLRVTTATARHTERALLLSVLALQVIARLGARATPTLPALGAARFVFRLEPHLRMALDGIARSQLFARMPAPGPEQLRDERARRLLEPVVLREPSEPLPRALTRWAAALIPYGHELCVRMALAAARRVVGLWEAEHPLNEGPREALFALEEWVYDANEQTARRAVRQGDLVPSQLCASGAFSASWAVTFATLCVPTEEERQQWAPHAHPLDSVEGGFLGTAIYTACRALQSRSVVAWSFGYSEEPSLLSEKEAVHEVRKAIVDELLPWVCGTWDPVTDVIRHRRELLPGQDASTDGAPPQGPDTSTGRYPP